MTDWLASLSRASPASETEAATFSRLYQEQGRALFNYCLYRVGDPATAEDLTADIFERAWHARRRYDPRRARFATWLFTIARRRVTDWQRRQARRPTVALDEQLPSPLPGPAAVASEAEDRRRLHQLVVGLPRDAQDLISMKFGAGMTNRQIAEIVGKSETAVGSALHRLVHKLRLQWEEPR
jgi:RNA polymerase sigma-70 factor (ECF subfamily)